MNEALHTVQNGAAQFTHPLIFGGEKLFPSVTRVFSRSREMYVYLQAYQRGAQTTQPLVAFVTFFRGTDKVLETQPLAVTEGLDARSKAVPVRLSIPMDGLSPGRYDCQVRSWNRTARRSPSGRRRSRSFHDANSQLDRFANSVKCAILGIWSLGLGSVATRGHGQLDAEPCFIQCRFWNLRMSRRDSPNRARMSPLK